MKTPATRAPKRPSQMPVVQRCACGGTRDAGGECGACRARRLARMGAGAGPSVAPPAVHDVLRSPGSPLAQPVRADMEQRLGHDFSRVRVHTDERAAASARAVGARAYTVGSDVVFGASGREALGTAAGTHLLAHELTHVRQQAGAAAPAMMPRLEVAASGSTLEHEADAAADAVVAGGAAPGNTGAAGLALARKPDDERAQAVAEAEAVAARLGQELSDSDEDDEPDTTASQRYKTPAKFLPGGFTDNEIDALVQEADARTRLASTALTLAERQARRREFWEGNPGYSSANVKEAFELDLYWDPNEEEFIRQPYVSKMEDAVLADPEAKRLYGSRLWDLTENKPEKKSRFKRTMDFVCKYTEPCSSNLEQFRKDRDSGMSRDEALNRGMARLAVTAELMALPGGPSGPIELPPEGAPTGGPLTGGPLTGPVPEGAGAGGGGGGGADIAPTPEPLQTTGGGGEKPPPEGKVDPAAPAPAAPEVAAPEAAAPGALERPGTVTVESSVQKGLVRPGGKLETVLRSIQDEFAATRPTTLKQGLDVVGRGTARVGLARGIKSQTIASEVVLKNVGGIETRVLTTGEIVVRDPGGQVVLRLVP